MQSEHSNNPTVVYDRVTEAWRLLLGEDLHYGYFADPTEPLAEATSRLTRRMADWLRLSADVEILDVGCGIGNPARFLAKHYGCRVRGISTSAVGLALATALTKGQCLDQRVAFYQADGMENGFPDSSFDCVWVMESSHLMPRKNALLAESARVLRPGGRFILCDIIRCNPIPLPELIRDLAKFKCLDEVFGKAKMEPLETYVRLAEANRLVVERVEDVSSETLPTFEKWSANAHANRDRVIELTGEAYWRQFVDACDYLTTFWQSKRLGYGMLLGRKTA
jgi:27-O-demethylrifamycin SV methyltransferase